MSSITVKERQQLRDFRILSQFAEDNGVSVRREKLARGHSYRVKSGECVFGGQNLVFVDKRLPVEQQLGVIVDFLIDNNIAISSEEASELSAATRSTLIVATREGREDSTGAFPSSSL